MKEKASKDFSLAVTESIDAALAAEAAAFGHSKQDIARRILQTWADQKAHEYSVYARIVMSKKLQTELDDTETELDGTRPQRRL